MIYLRILKDLPDLPLEAAPPVDVVTSKRLSSCTEVSVVWRVLGIYCPFRGRWVGINNNRQLDWPQPWAGLARTGRRPRAGIGKREGPSPKDGAEARRARAEHLV